MDPTCVPGFDSLVASAKAAIQAKFAEYKAKLDELRNLDMQVYIDEAIDKGIAIGIQLYQTAKNAIVSAIKGLLQNLTDLINDLRDIVELLSSLSFDAIGAVTEALTSILDEIPGVGALISAYEAALAAQQCL